MKILVLNAGSSSQKSCLYELENTLPDSPPEPLWEGKIDWTHQNDVAELKVQHGDIVVEEELRQRSRKQVIAHLLDTIAQGKTQAIAHLSEIDIVGHRVVHGGQDYQAPVWITPDVRATITRLVELAPAHNPANLEGIEAIEQTLGAVPQVAVFDTAFHSHLSNAAAAYPLPYEWFNQGIRRYGFHGINHQYCAERAAQLLGRDLASLRLITCHIGNGCSLAAIRNGHSVDTTMGFTPLEGLMMGSRSGSVDPGILVYLMRHNHYTADDLDRILNKESGLKGLSGVSADLRQIMQAIAQHNEQAQLAFDVYVHRLRSHIGAMLAALGGLDAIVFSGGVGENSAPVRAAACEAFEFLGLTLDPDKNAQVKGDGDIAAIDSTIRALVIKAQEDWAIARACWELSQENQKPGRG
ncbi:acetate kinase [Oculatella sp. LEGE 06141]|uniref:acetate/propionate family kinase n=1 Tax=Oculatella sp. LEGE 06141 TaxID=1828648 RepID=UPI00187F32F7|nr:acetate kinase [Oculatella sp. LEGE 06141]MBE9180964.1 acetate kinase [Oculatella sp. LEGE 06141]